MEKREITQLTTPVRRRKLLERLDQRRGKDALKKVL
jgi:hypothetical protein